MPRSPAALSLLIVMLLLPSCGDEQPRASDPAAPRSLAEDDRYVSDETGITFTYPKDWFVNDEGTTDLVSPEELVVVGSLAPVDGGECAPEAAIRSMATDDALIFLLEYAGGPEKSFPARPDTFSTKDFTDPAMFECHPRPSRAAMFKDEGRYFQVHLVWGKETSDADKEATLEILNSLEVDPT